MSAYVHHLQDGVFVRQIHIGDTATTGCMRSDTVVTGIAVAAPDGAAYHFMVNLV